MAKLSIIIGSTRPARVGPAIADWTLRETRRHGGFDGSLIDLADCDLPLLDEPRHPRLGQYDHEHTIRWSEQVAASDAFVFVTPEYNYGAPPALLNAISYLFAEWQYAPVAFVSYGGVSGGTRSVQMLKQVVTTLKMMPIPDAVAIPFFPAHLNDGVFEAPEEVAATAESMFDELHRWTTALAPLRRGEGVRP